MSSIKRQPTGSVGDPCRGCPGGCAQPGGAALADTSLQAPSAAGLNAVVGTMFGAPLVLLCTVVAVLELNAPNAHPLFSLGMVLLTLVAAGWVITAQRSKLLHRLQVQPYNP